MEAMNATGKSKHAWLAVIGLCLVCCVRPVACAPDPSKILMRIPLGSRLTELDRHLGKFYEVSSVRERAVAKDNEARDLGDYDRWTASKAERDAFTGEVTFSHYSSVIPDDLAPSFMVRLVYVGGVLKAKDYGILPG